MWEKVSRQRGQEGHRSEAGSAPVSLRHSGEATVAGAEAPMGEGGRRRDMEQVMWNLEAMEVWV